jgi:hypothetical protein
VVGGGVCLGLCIYRVVRGSRGEIRFHRFQGLSASDRGSRRHHSHQFPNSRRQLLHDDDLKGVIRPLLHITSEMVVWDAAADRRLLLLAFKV